MRISAEFFRKQAIRLRSLAKRADHDLRDDLIKIATEYDRLAEGAEAKGG